MSDGFKPLLAKLVDGRILTAAEAGDFFAACLRGEPTPAQVAAAVTAIRLRPSHARPVLRPGPGTRRESVQGQQQDQRVAPGVSADEQGVKAFGATSA